VPVVGLGGLCDHTLVQNLGMTQEEIIRIILDEVLMKNGIKRVLNGF
jgi:hypothetical protein